MLVAERRTQVVGWLFLAAGLLWPGTPAYGADGPRLVDKTLVVWARPANLDQKGAGVLSVLEADAFDSVTFGDTTEDDLGSDVSKFRGVAEPARVGETPAGEVKAEKGPLDEEAYPALPGEVQGEERYAEAGLLAE